MARKSSPDSYHTVSDSEASDFVPSPPAKRARLSTARSIKTGQKRKPAAGSSIPDIEDAHASIHRPHGSDYHSVGDVIAVQGELLSWFEGVR
jgi:hypothetical protein